MHAFALLAPLFACASFGLQVAAPTGPTKITFNGVLEGVLESGAGAPQLFANPHATDVTYDHLPKGAGTFIDEIIPQAVGKGNYFGVREFQGKRRINEDHYFTIGSMRNPCDYYVSLWAFGGALSKHLPDWLYDTTSNYKNSTADVALFRRWLQYIHAGRGPGLLSIRLAVSYSSHKFASHGTEAPIMVSERQLERVNNTMAKLTLDSMDCWIYTENLVEDTQSCLRLWNRKSGGRVNWERFDRAVASSHSNSGTRGACSDYFDNDTTEFVKSIDPYAFSLFGYHDCCAERA